MLARARVLGDGRLGEGQEECRGQDSRPGTEANAGHAGNQRRRRQVHEQLENVDAEQAAAGGADHPQQVGIQRRRQKRLPVGPLAACHPAGHLPVNPGVHPGLLGDRVFTEELVEHREAEQEGQSAGDGKHEAESAR